MDPASKVVVSSSDVLWRKTLIYWSAVLCLTLQVIKIGTSSLLRSDLSSINLSSLARVCETVKELRNMGEYSSCGCIVRHDTFTVVPCRTQSRAGVKRSNWCRLSENGSQNTPNRLSATTGSGCSRPDTPHALLPGVLPSSGPGETVV